KEVGDQAAVIDWYKAQHMHLNYFNPRGLQNLELHWGIAKSASPFAIDTKGLWERAWTEELNGITVHVLSPEDLLLHLSLHDAYYHQLNLFGLRPCCDMAVVVRHFSHKIDWEGLQFRAREWGIEKYLYLMLRLSREFLCADIPVDLLQSTQDEKCSDPIFLQAARRLLGKEIDTPTYKGIKYPIEIHMFNPNEGLFQKIGFFLKRIPISREELAFRYGLPVSSTRIWLYYLTRLASLILSYSRIYVPYFWFRLNRRNYRAHYTLDLWIKSPTSRKQIPLR
ncbi:MAG: nucleotidyltransferase family protein, partial [Candidatus Desulfacyla sp.]